jgi:hypothetical protein|tara:strand:- start:8882 stop:9376 length:495 start_codon:yes stop_codon:yes gene_type:complete
MSNNNSSALSIIPPQAWFYIIGIPVVIGGAYFLVARPVLKKLNVIKTKEDEIADNTWNTIKLQPFWTANYYKTYSGDTIDQTEASNYAKELNEAMKGGGWDLGWGTDEAKILGVFGSLGSKGNISKVAEAYNIRHNADLLAHLEDELDTEDLLGIAQKISVYSS